MKAARNGLGEETPEKRELIELIAAEYFPGDSKAKKEIQRKVIYWVSKYDVPCYIATLKNNAGTIKMQLAKDFEEQKERFRELEAQVNRVFYYAGN